MSGTDHLTRIGKFFDKPKTFVVYDSDDVPHTVISGDKSFGINVGYMYSKNRSKSFNHFQFDFQYNSAFYGFDAPFIYVVDNESWGRFFIFDNYLKYSFSFERCGYMGKGNEFNNYVYAYFRQGLGHTFHHRDLGDKIEAGYSYHGIENGKGVFLDRIQSKSWSIMSNSEVGLRLFSEDKAHSLNLGLVFNFPFWRSFTDQFEYFQDSVSTGLERIEYKGSTLMLNARYSYNFKIPKKTTHIDTISEMPDVYAQQSALGRTLEVQKTIKTTKETIRILVWDHGTIDDDIITVYFNGKLIRNQLHLDAEKISIELDLRVGNNYLVVYAENLGKIPPNTSSMIIKDGRFRKRIQIDSGLETSGAIQIVKTK